MILFQKTPMKTLQKIVNREIRKVRRTVETTSRVSVLVRQWNFE